MEGDHGKKEKRTGVLRILASRPSCGRPQMICATIWMPPSISMWSHLKVNAKQSTIGQLVDKVMLALERDNSSLKSGSFY